ncbi:HNH endonuclease [Enhygromyxa salina]|uniref:HNH endonuclease n=1 Tax=Enhygromyxa salina TaxID=215803 RepID=UPI0004E6D3DF|nr:HNH endonuclease signature motif containing protein [Enhygromyxa salina]
MISIEMTLFLIGGDAEAGALVEGGIEVLARRQAKEALPLVAGTVKRKKKKVADAVAPEPRRARAEARRQANRRATGSDGMKRCEYCGTEVRDGAGAPNSREFDHVVPWSRGGGSGPDNITVSCRTCNRSKGAKTTK